MLIQLYPSPFLSNNNTYVEVFDDKLIDTLKEMAILMRRLCGLGLAGPQVGINKRMFIMELGFDKTNENPLHNIEVVINPVIQYNFFNKESASEGCLSFPGVFETVNRYTEISAKYFDAQGNPCEKNFGNVLSRCFQHEFEHLQGEVFIKHVSAMKRDMIKRKMSKLAINLGLK